MGRCKHSAGECKERARCAASSAHAPLPTPACSLVIVTLVGFHLTTVEPLVVLYWWIQVAVGVTVAALASLTVFPVTVGGRVQATTADSLRRLGQLTRETLELMLDLPLSPDGRPAAATGNVQGPRAVDSGLEPMLGGLEAGTAAVLRNIESLRKLLALAATEWKVLHRLRQYLGRPEFPASTYHLLLLDIRSFLTALQMLVYPLQVRCGRICRYSSSSVHHDVGPLECETMCAGLAEREDVAEGRPAQEAGAAGDGDLPAGVHGAARQLPREQAAVLRVSAAWACMGMQLCMEVRRAFERSPGHA